MKVCMATSMMPMLPSVTRQTAKTPRKLVVKHNELGNKDRFHSFCKKLFSETEQRKGESSVASCFAPNAGKQPKSYKKWALYSSLLFLRDSPLDFLGVLDCDSCTNPPSANEALLGNEMEPSPCILVQPRLMP